MLLYRLLHLLFDILTDPRTRRRLRVRAAVAVAGLPPIAGGAPDDDDDDDDKGKGKKGGKDEDDVDALKERAEEAEADKRKAERALAELRKEVKELKKGQDDADTEQAKEAGKYKDLYEKEVTKREAAEAARDEAKAEAKDTETKRLLSDAAAKLGFRNPSKAHRYVEDLSKVEDEADAERTLKAVLREEPGLKGTTKKQRTTTDDDDPGGGGGGDDTDDDDDGNKNGGGGGNEGEPKPFGHTRLEQAYAKAEAARAKAGTA